jgi:hypothetical protein
MALDTARVLADLHAERAQYGATLTDDQCVELINAVAWKHRHDGWGLSGKTSGTLGTRYDGTTVAHDILHHQPSNHVFDCLQGAGAQSHPVMNDLGVNTQAHRPWVAPIAPRGVVDPPPPPPPPPPVVTACKFNSDEIATHVASLALALSQTQRLLGDVFNIVAEIRKDRQVLRDSLAEASQRALEAKQQAEDVRHALNNGLAIEGRQSGFAGGRITGVVKG